MRKIRLGYTKCLNQMRSFSSHQASTGIWLLKEWFLFARNQAWKKKRKLRVILSYLASFVTALSVYQPPLLISLRRRPSSVLPPRSSFYPTSSPKSHIFIVPVSLPSENRSRVPTRGNSEGKKEFYKYSEERKAVEVEGGGLFFPLGSCYSNYEPSYSQASGSTGTYRFSQGKIAGAPVRAQVRVPTFCSLLFLRYLSCCSFFLYGS